MNPTVTVVIPNYNHAPYLRERIDSVLAQTYTDFDVVVLDDCSTDDSRTIIESYRNHPRISEIILSTENSGNTFLQWQRGITAARGKFIWIAESDDVADKDFLSTLMPTLETDDKAVVAFSHSRLIDSQSRQLEKTWHPKGSSGEVHVYDGGQFTRQQLMPSNIIYNASMAVFRKSAFQQVPHDYQQFRYCDDWLFWIYLCRQGRVVEVCRQLNAFRQHDNKVTVASLKNGGKWLDMGGILTRLSDVMQLTPWQRRCLRGRWTKRFRKEEITDKDTVRDRYSDIFDGSLLDIICYELGKHRS